MKKFWERSEPAKILEPEVTRLDIPEHKIAEFYDLLDACQEHLDFASPAYKLWKMIEELFPQTKTGRWWVARYTHPLHPAIEGHA